MSRFPCATISLPSKRRGAPHPTPWSPSKRDLDGSLGQRAPGISRMPGVYLGNKFQQHANIAHTILACHMFFTFVNGGLNSLIPLQNLAQKRPTREFGIRFLPKTENFVSKIRLEGLLTDIPQMTSKFVEIVPLSDRQGRCIPFAAIRGHDFGNRPALGRPFGHFSHHPDTPLLSLSPRRRFPRPISCTIPSH